MYITKLGHACVLVETPDRVGLFDPGVWADSTLLENLTHIDRIIYTHEHPDHFDIEILQKLVANFPEAHVVCHEDIANKISDAGLQVAIRSETQCTKSFASPHEQLPVPGSTPPSERGYHFKDTFTHPGDSQSFTETKAVLAMPFVGPWGKTGDSIQKVLELQPKFVLPIHDWHYTDEAKQWLQGLLEGVFRDTKITLLPNKNGERIDVDV